MPGEAAHALDRLNDLRGSAGLYPLAEDARLTAAAQGHSDYLVLNQTGGHLQDPALPGFTGESPVERALAAGYLSRWVAENVSLGTATGEGSIDGLLAAIYHRFSLLANDVDEIGVGQSGSVFTYKTGNTRRDALCGGESFDQAASYYDDVCSNRSLRIEASVYEATRSDLALAAPDVILWPPADGQDIPPAFFTETPDPLPDHDVSGYPVSLAFNPARITGVVTVERLEVFDPSGEPLDAAHRILARGDDIHGLFSDTQFAFFPQARLEWGTAYRAAADYRVDGGTLQRLAWQFTTRHLPHPYYTIDGAATSSLDVISGRHYSIYFVPGNPRDVLSGYALTYVAHQAPLIDFVDGNTLNFSLQGETGHYARLNLTNGQEVTLTIAASDSAMESPLPRDGDQRGPAARLLQILAPLLLD